MEDLQYHWRVSKVTNLDHILSDNLVVLKIFSKKLHYSRVTFGQSRFEIRDD